MEMKKAINRHERFLGLGWTWKIDQNPNFAMLMHAKPLQKIHKHRDSEVAKCWTTLPRQVKDHLQLLRSRFYHKMLEDTKRIRIKDKKTYVEYHDSRVKKYFHYLYIYIYILYMDICNITYHTS